MFCNLVLVVLFNDLSNPVHPLYDEHLSLDEPIFLIVAIITNEFVISCV